MSNSATICNLLRKEKRQSELYIGTVPYNWEYMTVSFQADCTEALPLSLLDKTICGILHLDGTVSFDDLGDIMGFNVKNAPDAGQYRDAAEYSLLYNAVQSLIDFNMVSRDWNDRLRLTEIGREYYLKGKKFRVTNAKPFTVYLDITAGGHAKAKEAFQGVMARSVPQIAPPRFKDEAVLKTFLHQQLPDIYDPGRGNSFTNASCRQLGQQFTVPIQIGALYDVKTKETRYVAVVEDKVCKPITELIADNPKLRDELAVSLRVQMRGNVSLERDAAQQLSFEEDILSVPETMDAKDGVAAYIPSVMEPEEFWQALPLIIGEKEKQVFIKVRDIDHDIHGAIEALAERRPATNIFVSFLGSDEVISKKDNIFQLPELLEGDFLCCTDSVTYALRGYALPLGTDTANAGMVFRYPDADTDTDTLRVKFAHKILPQMYTDTMAFLDWEFEPNRRWVRAIAQCDKGIQVFRDCLSEAYLDRLQAKKLAAYNRVKLAFEKTLVDKVAGFLAQYNLEEIEDIKGIEELNGELADILKDTDETYISLQEVVRPIKAALHDREMYIREEKMAKYYIIDTNVFLDDPDILTKITRRDRIVLAAGVITELDKMKLKNADTDKGANARKAVRSIKEQLQKDKRSKKKFILLEAADMSLLHAEFQEGKGDNYILGVAVKFRDKNPFLLTSDAIFSLAAEVEKIPTISLKEFYEKNGVPPAGKTGEAPSSPGSSKTYMDVYQELYDKKGYVVLDRYEKACKRAGITPGQLGHLTFLEFVQAADEFTLSTNPKGTTYVNLKR